MVYSNKFVMNVVRNGKPVHDKNSFVTVPFGEYALRFRNRNNRRAVVKFTIDGENVCGGGYVIEANSYIDIDCFWDTKKRFKFVALDSDDAVDFGKDGPNHDKTKGTIVARFYLEREHPKYTLMSYQPPLEIHHHHHYKRPAYDRITWTANTNPLRNDDKLLNLTKRDFDTGEAAIYGGHTIRCTNTATPINSTLSASASCSSEPYPYQNNPYEKSARPNVQDGCTVEGNWSDMKFQAQYLDYDTENFVEVVLHLQGFEAPEEVVQADPVRTKKNQKLRDLEAENEALKQKLAELENERLKKKIEELKQVGSQRHVKGFEELLEKAKRCS